MDKPQDIETYYDLYLDYMQSTAWDELRTKRLIKDDFTCKLCGNRNNLQVHHLIYPKHSEFGSESLNDLITLCDSCHRIIEKLKKGQTGQYKNWHTAALTAHLRLKGEWADSVDEVKKMIYDGNRGNGIESAVLYDTDGKLIGRVYQSMDIRTFIKIRDLLGEKNAVLDTK